MKGSSRLMNNKTKLYKNITMHTQPLTENVSQKTVVINKDISLSHGAPPNYQHIVSGFKLKGTILRVKRKA